MSRGTPRRTYRFLIDRLKLCPDVGTYSRTLREAGQVGLLSVGSRHVLPVQVDSDPSSVDSIVDPCTLVVSSWGASVCVCWACGSVLLGGCRSWAWLVGACCCCPCCCCCRRCEFVLSQRVSIHFKNCSEQSVEFVSGHGLLIVQKSTSYNLDTAVAPNSRKKNEVEPNDRDVVSCADRPWMCLQPRLLEDIRCQPALCMTSERSLGIVWHEVLEQVSRWSIWSGWWGAGSRCGCFRDSLLSGNATWALPDCAAIFGMGAGMWPRKAGGVGALRVPPRRKACLRTWTMLGSSRNTGQVMRRPRPRPAVCAHTHTGMEQFCHRLIPPFCTEAVNLWSRVASILAHWCAKRRGVYGSEPEPVRWGRIFFPMASRFRALVRVLV